MPRQAWFLAFTTGLVFLGFGCRAEHALTVSDMNAARDGEIAVRCTVETQSAGTLTDPSIFVSPKRVRVFPTTEFGEPMFIADNATEVDEGATTRQYLQTNTTHTSDNAKSESDESGATTRVETVKVEVDLTVIKGKGGLVKIEDSFDGASPVLDAEYRCQ